MALLTSLLCAAGWFIPAPALPHSNIDTVVTLGATNPSISNTTDLPTLKSDSWCQEIPNDKGNVVWHSKTGQCTYNTYSGEVTLAGAQWIQVKPTDDSNPPSSRKTAHKHKECKRDGNDCDITKYDAREMVAGETTTIVTTCRHDMDPQACAHYYSAIWAGASAQFTCTESNGRISGAATATWTSQHKNKEWQKFTTPSVWYPKKAKRTAPACEADEYPPGYFLDKKDSEQFIRWIPYFDNRDAGRLWTGFCYDNDGHAGNGQRVKGPDHKDPKREDVDEKTLKFNTNLGNIKLQGKPKIMVGGDDGKTTTTSMWPKATYRVAVFSMTFSYAKDQEPSVENNCWPKDIVSEDPGYVLLTDDLWYDEYASAAGFPNAKDWRHRYAVAPGGHLIQAARKRQNRNDRRSPRDSTDEQPSSERSSRAAGGEELEIQDGRLIARNIETNATRTLTSDEIRDEVEVIPCKDKQCFGERQDNGLIIPAIPPPSTPSINHDAMPTFTPTQSVRTEFRQQKRTQVAPNLAKATN